MNPRVQVVILSSYPDLQMRQRALEAGAAAFLQKDPATDDIVNAVRKAANGLNRKNQ
jgi:DNA-binding NarL/FixJ family response regulator